VEREYFSEIALLPLKLQLLNYSLLSILNGALESAVLCTDRLLITGDFNILVNTDNNVDPTKLQDLFESVGLIQHVRCLTHIGGHALDLIVTRQSDKIIETSPIADYLFSDHSPVLCQLKVEKPSWKKSHVSYHKTKSINLDAFGFPCKSSC
jgi:exonuclease III